MRETRKAVCNIANNLVKQGYTRSEAMKKAWILAKLPDITVKVKGTAANLTRQTALEHLTHYTPDTVTFRIAADTHNAADNNAVAVIASVIGKGAVVIGYLPRNIAQSISPLLTSGITIYTYGSVTGGYNPYMYYGAKISMRFTA